MHQQRALPLSLGVFITCVSYSKNLIYPKKELPYNIRITKIQCYINK